MAIFKVPKITTYDRRNIILDVSEIVYDTDDKSYYGGDGETQGGFKIGESAGIKTVTKTITLTSTHISEKRFLLDYEPFSVDSTIFLPEGGIAQRPKIDYDVDANYVVWEGLGLDNFLEEGEVVRFTYYYI